MIASNGPEGWAQSGFTSFYHGTTLYFLRPYGQICRVDSDCRSDFGSSLVLGSRHTYTSLWYPGCTCMISRVDGIEYSRSWFNVFAQWTRPFEPEFMGETGFQGSDVPGSPSLHTNYTGLGAENYSNDTVVAMPCTMRGQISFSNWHLLGLGCSNFDLWAS